MDKKKLLLICVFCFLIVCNIYLIARIFMISKELKVANESIYTQQSDQKILFFAKLFVNKVLREDDEIDFEDRLKLENAVRDINDQEIFNKWQSFIVSKNSQEAQQIVADLFSILFDKIYK